MGPDYVRAHGPKQAQSAARQRVFEPSAAHPRRFQSETDLQPLRDAVQRIEAEMAIVCAWLIALLPGTVYLWLVVAVAITDNVGVATKRVGQFVQKRNPILGDDVAVEQVENAG